MWTNIDRLQTIEWYCASFVWKSVIAYVGLLLAERHCMFFEHNCWNFNEHISFGACLDWEVLRVKACSSISRCSRCWTLGLVLLSVRSMCYALQSSFGSRRFVFLRSIMHEFHFAFVRLLHFVSRVVLSGPDAGGRRLRVPPRSTAPSVTARLRGRVYEWASL